MVPIFAWEVSLALRLIAKGFNAVAIAPEPADVALGAPRAAVAASRG